MKHITIALFVFLTIPAVASADLACEAPGVVATSRSGAATVFASARGCRAHPTASYTVRVNGVDRHTIAELPGHDRILVSDSGRTLVLIHDEHVRADRDVVTVYRDGRRLGVYAVADLLGASSRAVREGRYVEVRVDGAHLVVDDVDGTRLHRAHLGTLRPNRRASP